MSEPDAAILELRIPRARLVHWLDSPIRAAATWNDWRSIPGSYYLDSGVLPLQEIGDEELAKEVAVCDEALLRFTSNRRFLLDLLESAEAPYLKRCSYDDATERFVACSLTYAENLTLYMQFLAVARGAASALDVDGTGIALIHNYLWEPDDKLLAVRLGPGPITAFVAAEEEYREAVARFQPFADEMISVGQASVEDPAKADVSIDELDKIK